MIKMFCLLLLLCLQGRMNVKIIWTINFWLKIVKILVMTPYFMLKNEDIWPLKTLKSLEFHSHLFVWTMQCTTHPPPPPHTHTHTHYSPTPTFFKLWYVQNMKWDVISKKIETKYIFWPLMRGYCQTCLKLGGRATQTSVVTVLAYQSTRAIYHIKYN